MRFIERLIRPNEKRFGRVVPDVPLSDGENTFSAAACPNAGPLPWLDRSDAYEAIELKVTRREISAREASYARDWVRNGTVLLEGYFGEQRLEEVWAAYERALEAGLVVPDAPATDADPLPGRTLNAHFSIPEVDAMLHDPSLGEVVSMLLGAEAVPFQTIIGHKGSEQRAHSDAIHMTTYPLGYLAAAWIAFEDISPEGGPLVYYPGSHRLPYIFSHDVGIEPHEVQERGYLPYHERYEPRVAQFIESNDLKPQYFTPRKGDVLVWHSNLLHGGSARMRLGVSRRALVCHYFARGCVTYHDLTASPSYLYEAASRTRNRR